MNKRTLIGFSVFQREVLEVLCCFIFIHTIQKTSPDLSQISSLRKTWRIAVLGWHRIMYTSPSLILMICKQFAMIWWTTLMRQNKRCKGLIYLQINMYLPPKACDFVQYKLWTRDMGKIWFCSPLGYTLSAGVWLNLLYWQTRFNNVLFLPKNVIKLH